MISGQYVCLQACTGCKYQTWCKAKASKKRLEKINKTEREATTPRVAPKYQSK